MARWSDGKPRPLNAKEQAQRHEERFATEVAASERLGALALGPAEDETARIRRLQVDLGIVRFEDLPEAKPLLEVDRVLKANLQRITDERDLINVERYLWSGALGPSGAAPPKGAKAAEFREKRDRLKAKLKSALLSHRRPKLTRFPKQSLELSRFSRRTILPRVAPTWGRAWPRWTIWKSLFRPDCMTSAL
jgi:hypothetical protein